MTTWRAGGRSGLSNAVFRVSVAVPVFELFDKDVEGSSKLSARLASLPVASEGRWAARLNRLDVTFRRMSSKTKSDEAFRICTGPPWSRVAA